MEESKLFVGNLSYSTTETELQDLFGQHGTVTSVNIIPNKGFGFVEMSNPAEAKNAIEALNLTLFAGRNLSVNVARPQRDKPSRDFKRY